VDLADIQQHIAADLDHLIHRHHEGGTVSIAAEVKKAITDVTDPITQGEAWLRQVVDEHLPALVGAAEKLETLEKSKLGQAILAVIDAGLGPEVEEAITGVVNTVVSLAGKAQAALPAAPGVPVPGPGLTPDGGDAPE
jgi:hypothetical protein